MSKLLVNVDTKRSQEERIPLWLNQLAKLGTVEVRQVLLVTVKEDLTESVKTLLMAMGMDVEEYPMVTRISLSGTFEHIDTDGIQFRALPEIGNPQEELVSEPLEVKTYDPAAELEEAAGYPVCPHCHEPFTPARKNQKICKKDFCKNEQQRIYMAAYVAKKKAAEPVEVSAEKVSPFESESQAPAEEMEVTKDPTTP